MTFEASITRLEEIVSALQHEELSLDRSLALFEEGIACLRQAASELSKAESTLRVLRETANGVLDTTEFRG